MEVKVFLVPFSFRGFTKTLFKKSIEEVQGNDYSSVLYLAPTPEKLKESRRAFHQLKKDAYIPPEMVTIKHLSRKLFQLYGSKMLISKPLIPVIISGISGKSIGFSSIISNLIEEIKQYYPGRNIEDIFGEFKSVFSELNIPEEGSKRAADAFEMLKTYRDVLEQHNAVDENDILVECVGLIERHGYAPSALMIDSFYEATPVEKLILKKLIEKSKKTYIKVSYDLNYIEITDGFITFIKNNFKPETVTLTSQGKTKEAEYFTFKGMDEEVESIARHSKNLFISGKNRDLENTAIAFPNINAYSDISKRVFKRYGLPYTLCKSKPIGKLRPFLDLLAMLESVADDYPRIPFSTFLISPHFRKIPMILKEMTPSITLQSGIIKGKNSWLNLYRKLTDIQEYEGKKDDRLREFDKNLRWILKKLSALDAVKETGTYKDFCGILSDIASDFDFHDDDIDVIEQLADTLRELSLVDSFDLPHQESKHKLRQFIDDIIYILTSKKTETEGNGVQITGLFDLRGTEPEYLYLGGLRDGELPSLPEIDHILPDSVRTKLGLVNMKKYLLLQKFIFRLLLESSGEIHLSFPEMEGERLFLPSHFLPWKRSEKERIPGIFCREEELLAKGDAALSAHIKEVEKINMGYINKKFGRGSHIRVTDIDMYRACPRKFFIERVLGFEPPHITEYDVDAKMLGSIIHRIMEVLITGQYRNFDEMRVRAEGIIGKILEEHPVEDYWKNIIRESLLYILPEIYEIESDIKKEGFSFFKGEAPVEGEIIEGIRLKGKIDRVDKKDDFVEIIDYKTGAAQLSGSQVMKSGATLQLFLYAALMKTLGFKINRVGIYSLKDMKISWVPGKNDKREGITIEDYIKACLQYLEETVLNMRNGVFTALPLNEQTCRNCSERAYCPYIQNTPGNQKM